MPLAAFHGDAWRVTRIEICVLKSVCRFEMCSHIRYRFFRESITFEH